MAAYRRHGLGDSPGRQPDPALALGLHRVADLLDQRGVVVQQAQIPVGVRRGRQFGGLEDLLPVRAQREGVVRRDREAVPEPLGFRGFLLKVVAQECGVHAADPGSGHRP